MVLVEDAGSYLQLGIFASKATRLSLMQSNIDRPPENILVIKIHHP
jgi:hypothetical protein